MNFHIGQKVVYVGTDREFDPNPGKTVHTIRAMRKAICGCDYIDIDVGITLPRSYDALECGLCLHKEPTTIWWNRHKWFRPLIEDYTEEQIEAVDIAELLEPEYACPPPRKSHRTE